MTRIDKAALTTSIPDYSLNGEFYGMKLCLLLELQKVSRIMTKAVYSELIQLTS